MSGRILGKWFLEATSGTTPPYFLCRSIWLAISEARISRGARRTATAVSSHEVSIANTNDRLTAESTEAVCRSDYKSWRPSEHRPRDPTGDLFGRSQIFARPG